MGFFWFYYNCVLTTITVEGLFCLTNLIQQFCEIFFVQITWSQYNSSPIETVKELIDFHENFNRLQFTVKRIRSLFEKYWFFIFFYLTSNRSLDSAVDETRKLLGSIFAFPKFTCALIFLILKILK